MTQKVSHTVEITERQKDGTIRNMMLDIQVDYDRAEDNIEDVEVFIYENGRRIVEVSKLLDKAEGSPLTQMIESINWREIAA